MFDYDGDCTINTPIVVSSVVHSRTELPEGTMEVGSGLYLHIPSNSYYAVEDELLFDVVTGVTTSSGPTTQSTCTTSCNTISVGLEEKKEKPPENYVYNNVADKLDDLITKYKQLKANAPLNEDWKIKTDTYGEIIRDLIDWRAGVI